MLREAFRGRPGMRWAVSVRAAFTVVRPNDGREPAEIGTAENTNAAVSLQKEVNMLQHPRRGFSRVELLVSLAVLMIAGGLGICAVQRAQQAAESRQTVNNLKQILLSIHNANDTYKK